MFRWLSRRENPSATLRVTAQTLEQGAPYILPPTAAEENRLDFQHQMLYRALGRNYGAPLRQPQKILDVGCGTGRWVVEMAMQFPQANLTGIDITPVNVTALLAQITPPPDNLVFIQGDILQGLPFAPASFDYVHQRFLSAALPEGQWPRVIQEIVRVVHPGGWVELGEFGPPVTQPGAALEKLWDTWGQLSQQRGINLNAGSRIQDRLAGAGLGNVGGQSVQFPLGDHGGRFGHAFGADLLALGRSLRLGVIKQAIMPEAEYDALYQRTQAEFADTRAGAYQPIYLAWGQKR